MKTIVFIIVNFLIVQAFCHNSYYVFTRENKSGVINQNGKEIIPAEYDRISIVNNNRFICAKDFEYGVVNLKNKEIIPFDYQNISFDGNYIVHIKGKCGVVDQKNNVLVPVEYDAVYNCGDNYYIVKNKNKYGIVDLTGKFILEMKYDYLESSNKTVPNPQRIVFKENDKYGYIALDGSIIIPAIYVSAKPYYNGQAIVATSTFWGVIDINGDYVFKQDVDCKYLLRLGSLYYAYGKNRRNSLLSNKGEVLVDNLLDDMLIFKNGTAVISKKNKDGLIDTSGKYILQPIYDGVGYIGDNGLIPMLKDGKWGFVNVQNQMVIENKFVGFVEAFSEGLAVYYFDKSSSGGRYTSQRAGYIDEKGEVVISPQFISAEDFKNGRAIVETDSLRLLINKKGETIFVLSEKTPDTDVNIDVDMW